MRFLLIVYLFLSPNGDPHPVTIPQSTAASCEKAAQKIRTDLQAQAPTATTVVACVRLCLLAWFALALVVPGARAGAIGAGEAAAESAQCADAIRRAARASGVPAPLLLALAPTESGLPRAHGRGPSYPWPWTLNTNGRGSFHFRTRAAAEKHLNALVAAGIDNIDIGCMQVNWRWHGAAFASPAAALNPTLNARYAAALLRGYRRQTGSWADAVGLYHSHTPALAEAYRCRVAHALRPNTTLKNCAP